MAEEPILKEVVPVEPEELLTRGALGSPGRLRIEVGLNEPRFAPPQGRRTPPEQLALSRALGGVSYPADRERVIAEAGKWLSSYPQLKQRLEWLPGIVYGGELEVLRRLAQLDSEVSRQLSDPEPDQTSEESPPSAGSGNQEGSLANR